MQTPASSIRWRQRDLPTKALSILELAITSHTSRSTVERPFSRRLRPFAEGEEVA